MIMFAIMLNVLLVFIALSLDLGRGYLARTTMSGASDAAALAGARKGDLTDANTLNRTIRPQAKMFFTANMPLYNNSGDTTGDTLFGISYDYNSNVAVNLDAQGVVSVRPTEFNVPVYFGFASREDRNLSVASLSKVSVASQARPVNYYLVLDTSTSMHNPDATSVNPDGTPSNQKVQRIVALKDAATRMINTIYPDGDVAMNSQNQPLYKVSISAYGQNLRTGYGVALTTDSKKLLNGIKKLEGNGGFTCSACGIRDAANKIKNASDGRNAIDVVIFMTDGLANVSENRPTGGSGRGWPAGDPTIKNNTRVSKCPYTNNKGNARYYDETIQKYPDMYNNNTKIYPAKATFPANYSGVTDVCAAGLGDMVNACDQVQRSKGEPIIYAINFLDVFNVDPEESGLASFAKDIVLATTNYCDNSPNGPQIADNGYELSEIFQSIVRNYSNLRIIE